MLRYDLLDCPDFIDLSPSAKVVLVYLLRQYNGNNNGDFSLTLTVLRKWGFTSNDTVRRAASELIGANLLELTRQGGRRKCSLYGVTFYPRDECSGKLELPPTSVPARALSMDKNIRAPSDGTQRKTTVPADGTPKQK